MVVDATGVGAGLSSFLAAALGDRLIPFVFTGSSKSQLGWDFLGVIESGRYKEHAPVGAGLALRAPEGERPALDPIQDRFWREVENVQMEAQTGPDRRIRWGVPNGAKVGGEYIHDDLVLSAALCAVLDGQEWAISGPSLIVHRLDPLAELDRGY